MNLINFIDDQVASSVSLPILKDWTVRQAVRAVLLNEKKQIALMHIGAYDVYKLPGGGMEEGENLEIAFAREMLEETGCEVEKITDLGIHIEKRNEWKMIQVSHCYLAKTLKIGKIQLDSSEQTEKFSFHWIDGIDKAIELVKSNKSDRYDDKYIKNRDLAILKIAKKMMAC